MWYTVAFRGGLGGAKILLGRIIICVYLNLRAFRRPCGDEEISNKKEPKTKPFNYLDS
ncbi:MAG: hypothetical protein JWQ54_4201 [Mucilaginibacter sp.]|nr:hypothetical protein [Mucilaginibacter sp.]